MAEKLPLVQGTKPHTLSVKALLAQPLALRKALIRLWLQQLGWQAPEAKQLNNILQDILQAKPDALPCMRIGAYELRRVDDVYALAPLTPHDATQVLLWQNLQQALWIESLQQAVSPSVLKCWLPLIQQTQACVTVQFRQGGAGFDCLSWGQTDFKTLVAQQFRLGNVIAYLVCILISVW